MAYEAADGGMGDIDRMMREAESHADEDKKHRELTDARNQADGLIYQIEKTLAENKEKVPAAAVFARGPCGTHHGCPRGRR